MTDFFDRASELEQLQRDITLQNRPRLTGQSALHCQNCGEPIPELRRQSLRGCTRCVDCQQQIERQQRRGR